MIKVTLRFLIASLVAIVLSFFIFWLFGYATAALRDHFARYQDSIDPILPFVLFGFASFWGIYAGSRIFPKGIRKNIVIWLTAMLCFFSVTAWTVVWISSRVRIEFSHVSVMSTSIILGGMAVLFIDRRRKTTEQGTAVNP